MQKDKESALKWLTGRENALNGPVLFGVFWALLFVLYFPAAKAGFVTDFTGWLDQVKNHSFGEFINRTHFQAKSLYQLTQFNTWVFYKIFGIHAWLWHLLFITLHALNAWLLFRLCGRLLEDIGLTRWKDIALGGALLFCVSPYISEVVVWEPAFHFLQGLLLILLVLHSVLQFIHTGASKHAWMAIVIYTASLFSLEIFYITPWLVLSIGIFYRYQRADGGAVLARVLSRLFLPMLILFIIRFVAYRVYAGDWVSRVGDDTISTVSFDSFSKPAKYLFHLLCLGRFWGNDWKYGMYGFFNSKEGISGFCFTVLIIAGYILYKLKTMSGKGRVAALLFVWMMAALLLLVPLWFQSDMLVIFDRYIYFAGAFFYMLFSVLVSFIPARYVRFVIVGLFILVNLRYAIQGSRYWGKAEKIVTNLVRTIPAVRDKTIILLNLSQCMHGIPMIGAEKNSEFKLMHDLLVPGKPLTNTVYDVLAYNMLTPTDGAHVNVMNDSLVKVTLNQWATWWWFETRGAYSYWTSDYKLDLRDAGHWYELTLRKPASQYLLLYNVGAEWKTVDMSRKEVDQN